MNKFLGIILVFLANTAFANDVVSVQKPEEKVQVKVENWSCTFKFKSQFENEAPMSGVSSAKGQRETWTYGNMIYAFTKSHSLSEKGTVTTESRVVRKSVKTVLSPDSYQLESEIESVNHYLPTNEVSTSKSTVLEVFKVENGVERTVKSVVNGKEEDLSKYKEETIQKDKNTKIVMTVLLAPIVEETEHGTLKILEHASTCTFKTK